MGPSSKIVLTNGTLQVWLSDDDAARIRTILESKADAPLKLAESKVFVRVNGYKNVASYTRAMPGQANVAKLLGKEFFQLAGALLSVGFQVYDDSSRNDLDGSQKLGRASVALLGSAIPPLGLIMLGAAIIWPQQSDQVTKLMFSDKNPAVAALADLIVRVGGDGFQRYSLKPSWIDFF